MCHNLLVIKDFRYAWESFKLSWKANGISSGILLLSTIYENTFFPLVQAFILARFLDSVAIISRLNISIIAWLISIYLIASIIKLILISYRDSQQSYQEIKTDSFLDLQIIRKFSELDPATFENPKFQNLTAQMDGIKGSFQAHLGRFTSFIDAVAKFVTATIVVQANFPLFAPLILMASIPSFIAWYQFRKYSWPYYVEKRSILVRVSGYIKSLLSFDSTSKEAAIFNTGPMLIKKIKSKQENYLSEFKKVIQPRMLELMVGRFLQFIVFIYTQYRNLTAVLQGTLGIGQFTFIFQQTMNLASSAEEMLNQYSSIAVRTKYLDKYFEFMNTSKTITSPSFPIVIPNQFTPPQIEFKNVTFRYPFTERDILKGFNLTVYSGEKIALVGENGSGKTTILKLLLRFYDVTEGELIVNGVNIKKIELIKWWNIVGALFQDFIKYQFTVRENIVLGNVNEPHNRVILEDAIRKSGVDSFLEYLPGRYDQVVGKMFDGGIDLSGGQWQKLALARTFYKNAPILILDEPTSAMDAKAEFDVFERVQKLQKDKTVIIISHRFSTVRNADRIIVLKNGGIIEEGSHDKLMRINGMYAELFNLQAKGYK